MVNNKIIIKQKLETVELVVAKVPQVLDLNESKLNELQLQRLKTFKHPKRQKEFYTSRALVNEVFENLDYQEPEEGKIILDCGGLSLSHSKDYIAAAYSKEIEVGIDVQVESGKLTRIKDKFVHESEHTISNSVRELNQLWSIKEAVFKRYSEEHLAFKRIQVSKREDGIYLFSVEDLFSESKPLFTDQNDSLSIACTVE